MPSFLVGIHLFVKVYSTKAVNTVKMHRRRCRLVQFVSFSQFVPEEASPDVINEAAAQVQPGGYSTTEGGGDPATLIGERDAVGRTLVGLPDPLRVPLLLSVVGGFSSAEIARILGVGEAAIRQRLSRARRQFKERYAAACGEVVRDAVATTAQQRVSAAPGANPRLGALLCRTA